MTGRPIWFGPDERPLFGMLHVPEGSTARAGVVLCSPLGREDLFFHSAYRSLAERLERHGIAALRFDYDGTGDSAGVQRDPNRVAAWSASTQAAVELMRSAGPPVVAAVGMRVGATLAAYDADACPSDAMVLWDPCRSGRTFLREQSALQAVGAGSGDSADGSVQTPGFRYDRDTVADLSGLDITTTSGLMADQILVLVRPDRGRDKKLDSRLETAGTVERGMALGQDERLNVNGKANAGLEETIDGIVRWLSTVSAADPAPSTSPPSTDATLPRSSPADARSRPMSNARCASAAPGCSASSTELDGTEGVRPWCVSTLPISSHRPIALVGGIGSGMGGIRPAHLAGRHQWHRRQWNASRSDPGHLLSCRSPPGHRGRDGIRHEWRHVRHGPGRLVLRCIPLGVRGPVTRRAQGVCAINPVFDARPLPPAVTGVMPAAAVASAAPASGRTATLVPGPTLGGHGRGASLVQVCHRSPTRRGVVGRQPPRCPPITGRRSGAPRRRRFRRHVIVGPDEAAEISKGVAGALREALRVRTGSSSRSSTTSITPCWVATTSGGWVISCTGTCGIASGSPTTPTTAVPGGALTIRWSTSASAHHLDVRNDEEPVPRVAHRRHARASRSRSRWWARSVAIACWAKLERTTRSAHNSPHHERSAGVAKHHELDDVVTSENPARRAHDARNRPPWGSPPTCLATCS